MARCGGRVEARFAPAERLFAFTAQPVMMACRLREVDLGRLTTHVLNTADGMPAAGMAIRLLHGDTRVAIRETRTNADGRCDAPLLEGAALAPGRYVLAFSVAEYFRGRKAAMPDPPFLDVVEIAFGVADASAHYHVPLLVSPWAYSTYRGS